jgi:hypothetical protein
MQTENTTTELALQEHVERLSASIERLNARIARLATALDVSLDKDSEVERCCSATPVRRRYPPAPHAGRAARPAGAALRRDHALHRRSWVRK